MNDFFKRLISKPITMERFNLDNFQDLGDVKIVIKETDGILQKGIHILCYKNWVEGIFKNLELLRLKYIQTNEDKYLDAILGVLPNSFKDFTFENQLRLQAENQELKKENEELKLKLNKQKEINKEYVDEYAELKKNALEWHKVTCFDKPDENGWITLDAPSVSGIVYLVKLKDGGREIRELEEYDGCTFFEDLEWEEIEAWAEIPEGM